MAEIEINYADMTPDKRYAAGPLWKPAAGDTRKEGDIIEEAGTWPHRARLVNRRELVEVPYGKWEYRATKKFIGSNGEKEGDVIDYITDQRLLNRLVNVGHLARIDVPINKEPELEMKKPDTSVEKIRANIQQAQTRLDKSKGKGVPKKTVIGTIPGR